MTILTRCATAPKRPGEPLIRTGDEIVTCGQFFHTGTPVVLWMDPGGNDAYRTERRFATWDKTGYEETKLETKAISINGPARYGFRRGSLDHAFFNRVRGGGWVAYHGLSGHYHLEKNKTDPGPAFDWDRVIFGARSMMSALVSRND